MKSASWIAATRRARRVDTSVRLGPLTLKSPIIAASGTFGQGAEVMGITDASKIGAVTVKSLSAEPWAGNPPVRVHPVTAGMLNAVGLQNPGVSAWVSQALPRIPDDVTVIASLWGRTVDQYAKAARLLLAAVPRIAAVEVNVSCPNLEEANEMFAHSATATHAVISAVATELEGSGLPIFAKLSPNTWEVPSIAQAACNAGATGLTLVNTVMGLEIDIESGTAALGRGAGGLSGPAIKPIAVRIVAEVHRTLPDVPIIGTGGVASGLGAVEMLMAGASAVGVGTASFVDPGATVRISREVARWCGAHGVSRVSSLTGTYNAPS